MITIEGIILFKKDDEDESREKTAKERGDMQARRDEIEGYLCGI